MAAHENGDFPNAEAAYRRILAGEGSSDEKLEAKQLLGALLVQIRRPQEGVALLEEVLATLPRAVSVLFNAAVARTQLGEPAAAQQLYERILELDPAEPQALRGLSRTLYRQQKFEEAAAIMERALTSTCTGDHALRYECGLAYRKAGKSEAAMRHIKQVVEAVPDSVRYQLALGQLYLDVESFEPESSEGKEAIEVWQEIVAAEPHNPIYRNNLATVLKKSDRLEEAKQECLSALQLAPDCFPALCNLGITHSALAEFDQALERLREAVRVGESELNQLRSGMSQGDTAAKEKLTRTQLGIAYTQLAAVENILHQPKSALKTIRNALVHSPDDTEARLLHGCLLLQCGEFQAGWDWYEARRGNPNGPRSFQQTEWDGKEQIEGKRILIHAEQGLGDTLQFVRFIETLTQRGATTVFLCQKPLRELLSSLGFIDELVADGDRLPQFDIHLPLLSLPRVLGIELQSACPRVPYLQPPAERVERWKKQLEELPGKKVGIAWQGNKDYAYDKFRSIALTEFAPLATASHVTLLSLQKGPGQEQLDEVAFEVHRWGGIDEQGAFLDTSAIMANLDLVVTSDSAIAHLAGGLGVKTWLATSYIAEWRWLNREWQTSPWYPTMRLYRQPALRDWASVFQAMARDLESL